MIFEILAALAIINATIPGQDIPIEVQTRLVGEDFTPVSQPAVAQSTTPSLVDAGMIGTIATLGGAMFAAYQQNKKRAAENESRVDATADTSVNLAQSLKATDKGTADIASNLATALQKLADANPDNAKALESCKEVAKENAQQWNQDIKEYYEVPPPVKSEDIGLDKVKTKLAEVNKMTTKTPESS